MNSYHQQPKFARLSSVYMHKSLVCRRKILSSHIDLLFQSRNKIGLECHVTLLSLGKSSRGDRGTNGLMCTHLRDMTMKPLLVGLQLIEACY